MVPPGGTLTQCTVYLLADGDAPAAVGFEDADEGDLTGRRAHVSSPGRAARAGRGEIDGATRKAPQPTLRGIP